MSTFWKIFITVIVSIAIAGGGTFYLMQRQGDSIRNDNLAKIDDLNKQIIDVNKQLADAKKTTTAATTTTTVNVYTHPELKYSVTLPAGYAGVDYFDCEGTCTSYLTIAKKISDSSYYDSDVKLTFNAAGKTLDQMVTNIGTDVGGDIMMISDVVIGGVSAKKYEIGGFAHGFDYFAASGKYNLYIKQYPDNDANQKVVDSILSTFKFPTN